MRIIEKIDSILNESKETEITEETAKTLEKAIFQLTGRKSFIEAEQLNFWRKTSGKYHIDLPPNGRDGTHSAVLGHGGRYSLIIHFKTSYDGLSTGFDVWLAHRNKKREWFEEWLTTVYITPDGKIRAQQN